MLNICRKNYCSFTYIWNEARALVWPQWSGLPCGQDIHMARAPMKFSTVLDKHLLKTCCSFTWGVHEARAYIHVAIAPIWAELPYGQSKFSIVPNKHLWKACCSFTYTYSAWGQGSHVAKASMWPLARASMWLVCKMPLFAIIIVIRYFLSLLF